MLINLALSEPSYTMGRFRRFVGHQFRAPRGQTGRFSQIRFRQSREPEVSVASTKLFTFSKFDTNAFDCHIIEQSVGAFQAEVLAPHQMYVQFARSR